jgi:transcriptional regulator with XRE-family HTH domain
MGATRTEVSPLVWAVKAELRKARANVHMSVTEAVEASGVAELTIRRLEAPQPSPEGRIGVPDVDQLARLAAAYGTTVTDILRDAESSTTKAASSPVEPVITAPRVTAIVPRRPQAAASRRSTPESRGQDRP